MEGQEDDQALRRIILTLLALAALAERASGASWSVRCLVLWVLRSGEAIARGFVREIVQTPFQIAGLSVFLGEAGCDNSSTGAMRLATRFKALAAALEHLLRQSRRFEREIRRIAGLVRHRRARIGADDLPADGSTACCARRNRPNDTS